MSQNIDLCSCNVIHDNVVQKVSDSLPILDESKTLAELFKIFGDPTRLRILSALKISEMCVCDLAYCLNMTHSAISHQLRILKAYNLVKSRKTGKIVYYSLADFHVTALLDIGLEHINE